MKLLVEIESCTTSSDEHRKYEFYNTRRKAFESRFSKAVYGLNEIYLVISDKVDRQGIWRRCKLGFYYAFIEKSAP